MRNGKILLILTILMIFGTKVFAAENDPGNSPKYPITFDHIKDWMNDPRCSMNLFEQTLRADYIATRYNLTVSPKTVYVMMDDGRVYQTPILHSTTQLMLWAPLFNAIVWEAVLLPFDILIMLLVGQPILSYLPLGMLVASIATVKQQSETEVPMPGIFHINILYTSDVMMLDLKRYGGVAYASEEGVSLLGRSYIGMDFKILEANSFFFGFHLVHFPHIWGWESFVTNDPAFANQNPSVMVSGRIYDETRVKIFLYNNLLGALQVRVLLNLAADEALDTLGVGLISDWVRKIWDFWKSDLSIYISYLKVLDKWSLDFSGTIPIGKQFALFYDYDIRLDPVDFLDYLKIGTTYSIRANAKRSFCWNTYISIHKRYETRQFGFYTDIAFKLPFYIELVFGVGYNVDETMNSLPFTQDAFIFNFDVQIGMNRRARRREANDDY